MASGKSINASSSDIQANNLYTVTEYVNHIHSKDGSDIHIHDSIDLNAGSIKNIESIKTAKGYINNLHTLDGDHINIKDDIDMNLQKIFNLTDINTPQVSVS